MPKILAAATSMFLFIAAANGQTAAGLAKKYHHHEVYEVAPGVQMTPKFDSTGAVCEMQVEQAHFVKDGVDVRNGIDERQVYPIIDELVPVSERGTKLRTFDECVGVCQTTLQYSNVAIMMVSAGDTRLVRIKWRNRSCE
ncbi:MAG TPA: hypothetical protein VNY29_14735 [Terriglobales bacterium]|jgi:hypothetical protein|nr:hypothetical protein [Terriglobales bacterium]